MIRWFETLGMDDVAIVGGKNASLGEMIQGLASRGVLVPGGFATTANAYQAFIKSNGLDVQIHRQLDQLDVSNMTALSQCGASIRQAIMAQDFSDEFVTCIAEAYQTLTERYGKESTFAVRSSATAEDLPDASFAGQQETYLNIKGLDNILLAIKEVFSSLFNDRAIAYRVHQGFEHKLVSLSAGIQKMVRSDLASSGVMFSIDTESGFEKVVFITSAYGLGETVVQGAVNPDEFYVYKPGLELQRPAIIRRSLGDKGIRMVYGESHHHQGATLTQEVEAALQKKFSITDDEVHELANLAITIEKHYGRAMDIEWAKDGNDGKLYIVQARPETVSSQTSKQELIRYELKQESEVLITGRSIGQRIGAGKAKIINDVTEINRVSAGDVLVTDMTDPDWEPIMKKAAAIITNRGGRTCHAAIIARELGIPAIVGTGNATKILKDTQAVTVVCAKGDTGLVYEGELEFQINKINLRSMPELPIKIMMNVASPDRAFSFQAIPNDGVGLARLEFIINRNIGIHPLALLNYNELDSAVKKTIEPLIAGYEDPTEYYVEKLTEGIATIAAAFAPAPVIVRLSDFKSNEYANLIGGQLFEVDEENPMLGFRGASRYISKQFKKCFELECEAIKRARNIMGLENIEIMVPFVRTLDEAQQVIHLLDQNGLKRGEHDLRIIMMCEIPSNALLADDFLNYFDGFSIGSNDLTQLTLALDRDSALVADAFDERNPAVKKLLAMAIQACKKQNKYIGICGQGPSDHPDLALWLVEQGINSISLNPDSVISTWVYLAKQLGADKSQ
ncbi:Phosphoenolpyruvate synthase [hydrothermal vent metagenome]|uniref:Phosphoenolpyruvate synthase n=1 Tax=hydrothermal vent metagenome TaxID=652676 RepID=A0A3B1B8R4_9ZZZZ